jgi:hypothetical protein
MGKKMRRSRPWTKEDVRTLKALAREKTKTTVIARKLKRSVAAVYLRASKLAVMLGGGRRRGRDRDNHAQRAVMRRTAVYAPPPCVRTKPKLR